MITIQMTCSGAVRRMQVDQVEFVRTCLYGPCRKEFQTVNIDQLYCTTQHLKNSWRDKHKGDVKTQPSPTRYC